MNPKILLYLTLFLALGLFVFGCTDPVITPSEFDQKVADETANLTDWVKANEAEKMRFAQNYTKLHFGQLNNERARALKTYLDGLVSNFMKGLDEEKFNQSLGKTQVHLNAKAGARLMGWPAPVGAEKVVQEKISETAPPPEPEADKN